MNPVITKMNFYQLDGTYEDYFEKDDAREAICSQFIYSNGGSTNSNTTFDMIIKLVFVILYSISFLS